MLPSVVVLLATAWAPSSRLAARSRGSTPRCHACVLTAAEQKLGPGRWEGDATRRPLGQMERLLNARRSWSGAMTTAHVSAALIDGPPPTEAELLAGLAWVLQRHPMLAACVRGKSKFHVPDAKEYPLHSDYLGKAVEYTKELLRTYPDDDIQRFEPSPLTPDALARRALSVVHVETPLDEAWRGGFTEAMDGLVVEEEGDGPLWRLTLYTSAADRRARPWSTPPTMPCPTSAPSTSSSPRPSTGARRCARRRVGGGRAADEAAAAAVGGGRAAGHGATAERGDQGASRAPHRPLRRRVGPRGRRAALAPSWEAGRARLSTIKYALWQMAPRACACCRGGFPRATRSTAGGRRRGGARAPPSASFRRRDDRTARGVQSEGHHDWRALCAAAALGASDAMGTLEEGEGDDGAPRTQRYKLLQALDMRTLNFGVGGADQPGARDDWSGGTVLAGTGSLDMLVDLPPGAGEALRASGDLSALWACAKECGQQTRDWIASGWARESLLLFSAGWEFMNMNRVVELGAQDRATLGRAFSAGLSNAGVFGHRCSYGDLTLSSVFFGISQTVSAPAISASAVTVDGRMCLTVQYASPIWPEAEAEAFADDLLATLKLASKPGS